MSLLLHIIAIYLLPILPLFYLYSRSYLWECFAPMMALIWPISLPFVIALHVWCDVSHLLYKFRHRNDPKIDWAEVFKNGPKMADPVPGEENQMYTGFLRDKED